MSRDRVDGAPARRTAPGAPAGARRSSGAPRWPLVVVAVLAFATRWFAYVDPRQLTAPRELDDATTYSAAVDVLHGQVLYADVLYLHPPGLVAALTPFAWLGAHVGDAAALGTARALMVLVGTLNAVLVAWLLRRRGAVAVLAGGGLYAVWVPVVYAERVVFLEPVLTLCLLLALVVLRLDRATLAPDRADDRAPDRAPDRADDRVPDRPGDPAGGRAARLLRPTTTAPLVAGALTGLAASFKIWAVITAVVLFVVVLGWRGVRAAGWFVAGGLAAAAVVVLPYALRAPGDFWRDVVAVQAGRPATTTSLGTRLVYFAPAALQATVAAKVVAFVLLAVVVTALVAVLVRGAATWLRARAAARPSPPDAGGTPSSVVGAAPSPVPPETAAWALLALALGATVLAAPSFFLHYAAFPAPALALLAGAGAGEVAVRLRAPGVRPVARRTTAAVAVVALAACTVGGAAVRLRWTGSRAGLVAWAAEHECVWGLASGVVAADAATRNAERGCPVPSDLWGEGLAALDGAAGTGPVEARPAWDAEMLRTLTRVDAAVLPETEGGLWLHGAAETYLRTHFREVGTAAGLEMWERT